MNSKLLRRALAALACLACVAAGARADPVPASNKLVVVGSSTMRPVIAEMARRFEARQAGVAVEVQSGGSGRGIRDARDGKADIGMVSRTLGDRESGLRAYPIARDGVCLIVHATNRVARLSDAQVRDIYSGRISNWKALGGADRRIAVIDRPEDRSSHELFYEHFGLRGVAAPAQKSVGDNADLIAAVAADAAAIGYVSIGEAERSAKGGAAIKLLPMDGIAASSHTVMKGDFPVQRPLTLVTKGAPAGLARAFIDFCLSPDVADIVRKHDFIPYND